MKCKNCGTEIQKDEKYCFYCGAKIEPEKGNLKICENCGAEVEQKAKFCPQCGNKFSDQKNEQTGNVTHAEDKIFAKTDNGKVEQTVFNFNGKKNKSSLKDKMDSFWGRLDRFQKFVFVFLIIAIIVFIVSICAGTVFSVFLSLVQIAGFIVALLMHNEKIKTDKKWLKYLIAGVMAVLTIFIFCTYPAGNNSNSATKTQKVKIPCSATECVGEKKETVKEQFDLAGFTYIIENELCDLDPEDVDQKDIVESVSIEGDGNFSSGKKVNNDAKVIINYHSMKKINAPISSNDAKQVDGAELVELFTEAGFTNVTTEEIEDLDMEQYPSGFENRITIDGTVFFDKADKFPMDASVKIAIHRVKDGVKTPIAASDCIYKDYKEIEELFKDCGFTNISVDIANESIRTQIKDGEIDSITIDDERNFKKDELFAKDAPVKITYYKEPDFKVTFIDVGQGDSALVECKGHYMLIDGGNKTCVDNIVKILNNKGVDYLDIVVGTHLDEEHIGGLTGILEKVDTDNVLCPVTSSDDASFTELYGTLIDAENKIKVPSVGNVYMVGDAKITILAVNTIPTDANNSSIVLKVSYGDTSFLFTGDMEQAGEQILLTSENASDLKSTVLKVSNHGSDNATSEELLRTISPSYAVISVGKKNAYGYPEENLLKRLDAENIKVLRTDLQGNIVFVSDGEKVSVSVDKNADANTLVPQETTTQVPETTTQAPETTTTVPETTTTQPIQETTEEQTEATTAAPVYTNTYIINTNTGVFHYPTCRYVKKMSEGNKWEYTGTRDEVISMGYSPCGHCHP